MKPVTETCRSVSLGSGGERATFACGGYAFTGDLGAIIVCAVCAGGNGIDRRQKTKRKIIIWRKAF